MSLQQRILEALSEKAIVPQLLYAAMRDDSREAIDSALRGLITSGQIVRRCGYYQRTDAPPRPPAKPQGSLSPRAVPGADLTHREEEIAELAAQGRTGRELADALGISRKTVESSLSRIYTKLQVRGKAELGERMRERAGGGGVS